MKTRNKPCGDNAERVIGDVRECVAELRWRGVNTVSAFGLIAEAFQVASWRIRKLFYRDDVLVSDVERQSLAMSAVALLNQIAEQNEERARLCRAKAQAIRSRELKSKDSAWRGVGNCGGDSEERFAA